MWGLTVSDPSLSVTNKLTNIHTLNCIINADVNALSYDIIINVDSHFSNLGRFCTLNLIHISSKQAAILQC